MDAKLLRKLVTYDPETGRMFWKERTPDIMPDDRTRKGFNRRLAGKQLKTVDGKGYYHFNYLGTFHRVHRMAWLYVHGELPTVIDHANGDPTDNRLDNLRNVTYQQNNLNQGLNRKNTSGVPGVYKNKRNGLWCAQMKINGHTYHIGSSRNFFDAVCMRKGEEQRLGFSTEHARRDANKR